MALIVLGLLLWSFAHLAKRIIPGFSRSMGAAERPMTTALITLGTVLMVLGYRAADGAFFWGRTPALVGVNNLLMLIAVYLFAAAGMKTWLSGHLRHPMLMGVVIWTIAHLLVNGDVPSFVLFGGIGIWALIEMVVIGRAQPRIAPPAKRGFAREMMALGGTIIVYGAIAGVHYALGYPTFG